MDVKKQTNADVSNTLYIFSDSTKVWIFREIFTENIFKPFSIMKQGHTNFLYKLKIRSTVETSQTINFAYLHIFVSKN